MLRRKNRVFLIFTIFIIPVLLTSSFSSNVQGISDEFPKIGFTWINGIVGASELNEPGYVAAIDMGAQLEHRDYSWVYLNSSLNPVYEWKNLYVDRFEGFEASISINVINSNFSSLNFLYNFTRYTTTPSPTSNITRINDTKIVIDLKTLTDSILTDIGNFSYISFGSDINGYFETYFDYDTESFTSTAMLDDYVDLYEQMYDYIKAEYPSVKVMTIFRNQIASDPINIAPMINRFQNACDIYAMSCRIFTNDLGFMQMLSQEQIIERYEQFITLTGTKKFAITNTFTISDAATGGSESYQAQFVDTFFQLINDYSTKMEFSCWYRVFDFPPGYLGMLYDPFLEAQRTSGLLTQNGDYKLSYFTWIEQMKALGRIEQRMSGGEIALVVIVLTAIGGFIIFTSVMEGLETFQKKDEEEEMISPDEDLEFTEPKKKKRKEKYPEADTLIFTENGKTKEENDDE